MSSFFFHSSCYNNDKDFKRIRKTFSDVSTPKLVGKCRLTQKNNFYHPFYTQSVSMIFTSKVTTFDAKTNMKILYFKLYVYIKETK